MSQRTESTVKKESGQRLDLYQQVTDRIIAMLEEGTPPWRKTWGGYGLAKNYATKRQYSGINMILLNLCTPYEIPYYLTWEQIKERGGKVLKGSKAEWVYFYKTYFKDGNGNTITNEQAKQRDDSQTVSFLKRFRVFNIECIEGIAFDLPARNNVNVTLENCEELLQCMNKLPDFSVGESLLAYYDPAKDVIQVPDIKRFDNSEEFYNTTYHEIVHWTGHESRLARSGIIDRVSFGSEPYAEEELIAEMGASYLCALTGIDREKLMENNAAYINGWLSKLRADKRLVFRAASAAQKAVNYITGQIPE